MPTGCSALFAWLLLLPSMVAAQQITVNLDPAQTKIQWTLGATLHTVHGTFRLRSGSVTFDLQSGPASGEIIVSPQHVMGKLADQGTSNLQVQGVLHIHGANHDLTLSLPVETSGGTIRASTNFVVPYQQWGMKDPSTFLLKVEKTVSLSISSVGRLASSQ